MFTLNIPVTVAGMEAIKADLTRRLPHVKSCHRCEALARGLGFRTYAALLAAAPATVPIIATANGAAFSAYLADHGFELPPRPFYCAVARVAIGTVAKETPVLTMWGITTGQPRQKSDGTWENWRDM